MKTVNPLFYLYNNDDKLVRLYQNKNKAYYLKKKLRADD